MVKEIIEKCYHDIVTTCPEKLLEGKMNRSGSSRRKE